MSGRQSFYVGIKAIISCSGGVLLLKDKAKDKWEFPGGRIDEGENIEEAMSRELHEELPGAQLDSHGEVLHVAVGDFMVENDHKLCLIFYAVQVSLPKVIKFSSEHTEQVIATPDNFRELDMFTTDQAALEEYFARQELTR